MEQTADWQEGFWLSARRADSQNFGERPQESRVSLIVLHNISLPPDCFGGPYVEQFFTNSLSPTQHPYFAQIAAQRVSAHFFLRRDGEIIQFVSLAHRAWHSGASIWQGRENCNDYSVGIELEGSDQKPYETAQYAALFDLIAAICRFFPITAIAGHEHIAPGRKTDPGPFFDWPVLAARFPHLAFPDFQQKISGSREGLPV